MVQVSHNGSRPSQIPQQQGLIIDESLSYKRGKSKRRKEEGEGGRGGEGRPLSLNMVIHPLRNEMTEIAHPEPLFTLLKGAVSWDGEGTWEKEVGERGKSRGVQG